MKVRSMITVGALSGGLFFGSAFAAHAGVGTNTGSCTNTKQGGTTAWPVADPTGYRPNIYTNGSAGPPPSGDVGVDGSGGYIEAGGSASGGYVSGNNSGPIGPAPASGLNGTIGVDSTPSACIGVAGKGGVSVSVP